MKTAVLLIMRIWTIYLKINSEKYSCGISYKLLVLASYYINVECESTVYLQISLFLSYGNDYLAT